MDIREVLLHIRAGDSDKCIGQDLNIDRRTVKRYRVWGETQGLLEGELPSLERLHQLREETMPSHATPQNVSSVEPYREAVSQWVKEHVEMAAIHCRLQERGNTGSYSAVRRFVRTQKPLTPEATVRVERPPGEEAQSLPSRTRGSTSGMVATCWIHKPTKRDAPGPSS